MVRAEGIQHPESWHVVQSFRNKGNQKGCKDKTYERTPELVSGFEKSTYETDFLIQKNGGILPLEVKAEVNLRSKSLKTYFEKYQPAYAVRTSMAGAVDQGWVRNIPLWAIQAL